MKLDLQSSYSEKISQKLNCPPHSIARAKMWLEGVSFLARSTIPALSQYRLVKDIYLLERAVLEQGKQGEKKA